VAGIAVFREGLAEQRSVGDNGDPGAVESDPQDDGAGMA